MDVTYILTVDGRTKVEWWKEEDFKGRVTQIVSPGEVTIIPIPDDVVLCDFCNEEITEYPVPVVGSYALCGVCFKDIQKGEDSAP